MAKRVKKSRKSVPENESKSERFVRVVTPRVNKAVKAINVIGYCAGSSYAFTDEQIIEVIDALTTATNQLSVSFSGQQRFEGGFLFKE